MANKKKGWITSASFTISEDASSGLNKMMEDANKRYEEERERINARFLAVSEAEYAKNMEFYHGVEECPYPEEMRRWLKEATDGLKLWALREGWNMCYEYHKDIIEGKTNDNVN